MDFELIPLLFTEKEEKHKGGGSLSSRAALYSNGMCHKPFSSTSSLEAVALSSRPGPPRPLFCKYFRVANFLKNKSYYSSLNSCCF